jgi:hypothetical protein
MCAAVRAATSQYRGPALSTRIKPVSRVEGHHGIPLDGAVGVLQGEVLLVFRRK